MYSLSRGCDGHYRPNFKLKEDEKELKEKLKNLGKMNWTIKIWPTNMELRKRPIQYTG